jgi:uncharacterized protein (TIRG00374 family)
LEFKRRVKLLKILVQFSIGIVILLYLLQLADASKVFSILLMINPVNVLLASIFFIIASTFVALALYIPIKSIERSAPMDKVILGSFAGQLLSDVTPVRSGYFATPLILKALCNVSVEKGMVGVLATGIVNSFAKVVISVIALIYFISFLRSNSLIVNAIAVGILFLLGGGIFLLIILIEKRILKLIAVFEKIPIIKVVIGKLINLLNQVQEGGVNIKKHFPIMFLLIVLSVLTHAMALQFISDGFAVKSISLIELMFIATLVGSLMYIPVTIAGLGVQETGYVLLLTSLGMPFDTAVAFALLARVLFTGTDIIGLPALMKVGFKNINKK